jgi:hypothetical protein
LSYLHLVSRLIVDGVLSALLHMYSWCGA